MGVRGVIQLLVTTLAIASLAVPSGARETLDVFVGGSGRSIHIYVCRVISAGGFSVDTAHARLKLSSVDHAEREFFLNADDAGVLQSNSAVAGLPPYTDGSTMVDLAFRVPSAVVPDMYAVTLLMNGAANRRLPLAQPVPPLVYIPSPDIDKRLNAERNTYVGRTAYAYPFNSGNSGIGQEFAPYERGAISKVTRGGQGAAIQKFQGMDGDFTALQPLVIRFGSANVVVSDTWEIARTFSLTDPREHPKWPHRFESAFDSREIVLGMTHDMVSRILGYPAAFGTIAQLDAMNVWTYNPPTPFGSTVYFKNDRVVKYDPPGNDP